MADTQAAPQIVKALAGVLPDAAVRQLMQALGNCNQPYTSRAPQNFQPNEPLGNANGVYGPGRWNPSDYPGLLPTSGSGPIDMPGQGGNSYVTNNRAGDTNNYDGNTFNFPTTQNFNLNNYYGGSTFNVGGNSTFNNITTQNITTQNITVVNGGGGGGGFPQQPQEPAVPGDGGASGGGGAGAPGAPGWGGPTLWPPTWIPSPFGPGGFGPRPPFTGTITVTMPTGGELTDDCKLKFTGYRGVPFTVSVR